MAVAKWPKSSASLYAGVAEPFLYEKLPNNASSKSTGEDTCHARLPASINQILIPHILYPI